MNRKLGAVVGGAAATAFISITFASTGLASPVPAIRGAPASEPGPTFTWSTFTALRGDELAGVSAHSASDVWAVGLQPGGRCQFRTLTENWNGSTWTVVPSPSKLNVNSALASVSGTSASDV